MALTSEAGSFSWAWMTCFSVMLSATSISVITETAGEVTSDSRLFDVGSTFVVTGVGTSLTDGGTVVDEAKVETESRFAGELDDEDEDDFLSRGELVVLIEVGDVISFRGDGVLGKRVGDVDSLADDVEFLASCPNDSLVVCNKGTINK